MLLAIFLLFNSQDDGITQHFVLGFPFSSSQTSILIKQFMKSFITFVHTHWNFTHSGNMKGKFKVIDAPTFSLAYHRYHLWLIFYRGMLIFILARLVMTWYYFIIPLIKPQSASSQSILGLFSDWLNGEQCLDLELTWSHDQQMLLKIWWPDPKPMPTYFQISLNGNISHLTVMTTTAVHNGQGIGANCKKKKYLLATECCDAMERFVLRLATVPKKCKRWITFQMKLNCFSEKLGCEWSESCSVILASTLN